MRGKYFISEERFNEVKNKSYRILRDNFEDMEFKINFDYFLNELKLNEYIQYQIINTKNKINNKENKKEIWVIFKCEKNDVAKIFIYDRNNFRSEYALQDIYKEVLKYLHYDLEVDNER